MSEGADDQRGLFPSSVGEQLSAERVRQSLELSDIAARTRIPLRHLEAIENSKYAGLPALPYSAGFVKTYANMLGLEGQKLSTAFRAQMGDERRAHFEPEAYEPVDPSRVPSRLLAMIALGVALLLGMGYLLLRFEGDSSDLAKLAADTVQDARPVTPKPAPPPVIAEPAAAALPTGPISIAASEDVWIKVSEAGDRRVYFIDVLKAGQSFAVPEDAIDPVLRTGRPQSLKVLIGATELPPVGNPDQIVRAYSLKRDTLVAIATAKTGQTSSLPASVGAAAAAPQTAEVQPPSAIEPRPRPRRLRSATAEIGPAASGVDSAEPISEPDQRPQP